MMAASPTSRKSRPGYCARASHKAACGCRTRRSSKFIAAVTRPLANGPPLLSPEEARQEAEDFLLQFEVLYPTEGLVRTALRGAAAYHLSWFDAHLWAYADYFGLEEIVSEDFQHERRYGAVKARNPFLRE